MLGVKSKIVFPKIPKKFRIDIPLGHGSFQGRLKLADMCVDKFYKNLFEDIKDQKNISEKTIAKNIQRVFPNSDIKVKNMGAVLTNVAEIEQVTGKGELTDVNFLMPFKNLGIKKTVTNVQTIIHEFTHIADDFLSPKLLVGLSNERYFTGARNFACQENRPAFLKKKVSEYILNLNQKFLDAKSQDAEIYNNLLYYPEKVPEEVYLREIGKISNPFHRLFFIKAQLRDVQSEMRAFEKEDIYAKRFLMDSYLNTRKLSTLDSSTHSHKRFLDKLVDYVEGDYLSDLHLKEKEKMLKKLFKKEVESIRSEHWESLGKVYHPKRMDASKLRENPLRLVKVNNY